MRRTHTPAPLFSQQAPDKLTALAREEEAALRSVVGEIRRLTQAIAHEEQLLRDATPYTV